MEKFEMESPKESINGIFAQLGLAVDDKPEIFGDRLQEVQMALQDWEDALAGNHGLDVDVVEGHLRDLYKLLEASR